MVDTKHDNERQAGLSSAHLGRVGLTSEVHFFRQSAQHFACRSRFLAPCRVPCSTIFARVSLPHHIKFLLSTAPTSILMGLSVPLLLCEQTRSSCSPSIKPHKCACNTCSRNARIYLVVSAVRVQLLQP